MTSDGFPAPQPSATLAVQGNQHLQRLLHLTLRNVTVITGRRPVIVPITKDSPLGIYANHDLKISTWEDPWYIVGEIKISRAHFVETASSPAPPNNSVSAQNAGGTKPGDIDCRPARMPHLVSNTGFEVRRTDTGVAGSFGRGARYVHVDPRAREASIISKQKCSPGDTTVAEAQTSWVPRISQGRKLFMRVFPYEIQNIMHAFGEVRFCSADVLEFMEDAVRNITQRVALGVLTRFHKDELTVRDLSTCVRKDPRALHRLLFCLLRARQKGEDLRVVRPTHREWDSFLHYATIHGIKVGESPSLKHLQDIPLVNIHISCSKKARSMFRFKLGKLFGVQHEQCIQSYLTDRYSRCPAVIGGRRRIDLFREWLALPDYVRVTEGSLHALGNLTREAVGIITQTALVLEHRRALFHSYERMLVDAIGFGIGAGVMVPLSALQTYELLRLLKEMQLAVKKSGNWSFREGLRESALEVKHVREAWRQLDDPDALAAHRPFWFGL